MGWLSTLDDYFDGKNLGFYIGSISSMFDTVFTSLENDRNKTFNYAEMKFFKMWWDKQTPEKKASVRKLIKEGRFNIVNGGWSAPDEAVTSHDDIIDNFMTGHRFIQEELGSTAPSISWQLDSFGVSQGYARLARDLGFDAMFYSRIDTQ